MVHSRIQNAEFNVLIKALQPLGDSKPDWEIFQLIAQRMGADWNYKHPSEIMDEIAGLTHIHIQVKL